MLECNVTVITNISSECMKLNEEAMGKISPPPHHSKIVLLYNCVQKIYI